MISVTNWKCSFGSTVTFFEFRTHEISVLMRARRHTDNDKLNKVYFCQKNFITFNTTLKLNSS